MPIPETIKEQDVTITNLEEAHFENNPVDPSAIKFSTWMTSLPAGPVALVTPFPGSQGFTATVIPSSTFVGECDVVNDVWFNNDTAKRHWWKLFVTAAPAAATPPATTALNPAVTKSRKKHKYA